MAIANFEQLCSSLCDFSGIDLPSLAPEDGMWSATLDLRGVDVTLMQYEDRHPGTVSLIADFGPMPEQAGLSGWLALMDANLLHSGLDSPAYCRNPDSGHVLLHRPVRLDSSSASDVHVLVNTLVDMALQWREDQFVPDPEAAYSRLERHGEVDERPTDEWKQACESFDLLYRGIVSETGQPLSLMPPPAVGEARAFRAEWSGVSFTVAHAAHVNPGFAWVVVHLGAPSRVPALAVITQMMDMNFALIGSFREAKFSRVKLTGELLLQYAFALAGSSPRQLLSELAALRSPVSRWGEFATSHVTQAAAI